VIKPELRASKIVEDLALYPFRDREPHSCRLSKTRDLPRLQPAPRPTRYAEKIDPAQTREGEVRTGLWERKKSGQRSVDREDRLFHKREAVMEWVLKLETRNGWGEMKTIEVGRLERRVVGLTAEEVGLTLAEAKNLLGELGRLVFRPRWKNLSPALGFAETV
jgi:hypothetical protein